MLIIGFIVIFLIIFIFSSIKIRNEKLSIWKYVSLIFLPPLLVGLGTYISSIYTYFVSNGDKYFPEPSLMLFIAGYGLIIMLPALMLYAVHILSLAKKSSPSKWKLFMWAGLLGAVSTLPYLFLAPFQFIVVPMITGSLAMMTVYFVSNREK